MSPVRLPRRVLSVFGLEAARLLDSLLTNRVEAPVDGAPSSYAALLSPQGKVFCDLFLAPQGDGFLLDVADGRAEEALRRLRLYRLRAKVEITDASDAWAVVAGLGAADPRSAGLGLRTLLPAREAPAFDAAAFAAYEAMRIGFGAPDPAIDAAPEEVFALEALFEELNGVDFQKGCFIGQENVSRMKRRATTRRKFCRVAFDGPAPAFGAAILAGEVEIGSIRSAVEGRAIALLRLDRAAGRALSVDGRDLRLDAPSWLLQPDTSHGE